MDDINESDCCGNGCANCILNIKPAKYTNGPTTGKQNILEKYTGFLLLNKYLHSPEVQTVWELHFKSNHCNDGNFVLHINAGHHLMMRKVLHTEDEILKNVNGNGDEKERKYLLRPYSPFWWDGIEMEFKIIINLIPNGPMSEYIKRLRINDEVEFRGPIGTFKHQINTTGDNCLLIISQGIAIASVLPIVREIINNEDDLTRVKHIACFKDLRHIYFRDNLSNFNQFWNYKAHVFLAKEVCNSIECTKNSNCLETCHNFKNKLKCNEIIKPYRLTEHEFIKIAHNINCAKANTTVLIAGNGNFQNCYMKLCQSTEKIFQQSNIHLL